MFLKFALLNCEVQNCLDAILHSTKVFRTLPGNFGFIKLQDIAVEPPFQKTKMKTSVEVEKLEANMFLCLWYKRQDEIFPICMFTPL
ncbi:hypothetical protein SADUNF_Sadunf14G0072000 [Salix dunnii]|uniref:Uncharacterized protein n=1 Tax=Salix dunnii TaxID=1413687 RepID=A0A835JI50_9ROSI|nr:hypothetical protein SADUNF_Sadunf14G0072000 [Salix dunnii]